MVNPAFDQLNSLLFPLHKSLTHTYARTKIIEVGAWRPMSAWT
jgi:hypothetical protein